MYMYTNRNLFKWLKPFTCCLPVARMHTAIRSQKFFSYSKGCCHPFTKKSSAIWIAMPSIHQKFFGHWMSLWHLFTQNLQLLKWLRHPFTKKSSGLLLIFNVSFDRNRIVCGLLKLTLKISAPPWQCNTPWVVNLYVSGPCTSHHCYFRTIIFNLTTLTVTWLFRCCLQQQHKSLMLMLKLEV